MIFQSITVFEANVKESEDFPQGFLKIVFEANVVESEDFPRRFLKTVLEKLLFYDSFQANNRLRMVTF